MKRHITNIFSLAIASLSAVAQSYVQPSPDANALLKFANVPVNYYTGTPAINIPLTEIHGKLLSVPVGLSYNASGFKVQEVASATGLGWSLTAGGLITRVVRGLPDEDANGYCGVNNIGEQAAGSSGYDTYTDNVATGVWDGEPDIFYFNFLGYAGKFILDANGQAFTMPYQDLQIKPGICANGSGEWQVVDQSGIVYKFGSSTAARETTTYKVGLPLSGPEKSYISSWYLTEIDDPKGTDQITISYTGAAVSYVNYYLTKFEDNDPCNGTVNNIKDQSTLVTTYPKYPATIFSSLGHISFSWTEGRQDMQNGVYLESISVFNSESALVHKNRFEYSYFQSSGCSSGVCKRLRLDQVYDLAPDPIASFTYNTAVNLPSRDSPNIDHWGYYNNNTVNSWLPESHNTDIVTPELNHGFSGSTRQSDPEKVKANVLERIDFRTDGYQTFEFEGNVAFDHVTDQNYNIGGVRIKSITVGDGYSNTTTRNFAYVSEADQAISTGLWYYYPTYYAFHINYNPTWKRYSHSIVGVFDINGAHIGYSRVEESITGLGKTVYYFSNFDTNPDDGQLFDVWSPIIIPATSKAWERGNLLEMKIWDNQGNLLARQVNKYSNNLPNKRSIKAWVTFLGNTYECETSYLDYSQGNYSLISRPFTLRKHITETYQPGTVNKIIQVENYEYDLNTYQLIRTLRYDSLLPSTKSIQETRYVTNSAYNNVASSGVDCYQQFWDCRLICDAETNPSSQEQCYANCYSSYQSCLSNPPPTYSESAAILALKNRHQNAVPIESISKYQSGSNVTLLSSQVNIYQKGGTTGNQVTLKETWGLAQPITESSFSYSTANANTSFSYDSRLRKTHTFDTYDQNTGNLTKDTGLDGISTSYQWGHANSIITSATINPTITPRTTSSSFIPLVGKISQTDPNNLTTFTEYDPYGRISKMRDPDGNIITSYRYNYLNETPGFCIKPDKVEELVNGTFQFDVVDVAASSGGTPQFSWNFGDGAVNETGSLSVSHNYSATGNYTITLTGLNPEFGSATRTTAVGVYSPMSGANICANGPVHVDLCVPSNAYYGSCTTTENQMPFAAIIFTGSVSNGCPSSYSYLWQVKENAESTWTTLGSGQTMTYNMPNWVGNWQVKCTITDGCGNTAVTTTSVDQYQSYSCN